MEPNPGVTASPAASDPPPAPGQPMVPVLPVTPVKPRRHPIVGFFKALPPILVIGGLVAFVLYSLYVYKPAEHTVCANNTVAQQTDVAINAVRQWFGKQGQEYLGCAEK